MAYLLIILCILITLLIGYIGAKEEARVTWLKIQAQNYFDIRKLKFPPQKKEKHILWLIPRGLIIVGFSLPFLIIPNINHGISLFILNIFQNSFLFRFWHDSRFQVESNQKFTNNADGLSSSFLDKLLKDTWFNRKVCLTVAIILLIAQIIISFY